jgi:hypothetical protein
MIHSDDVKLIQSCIVWDEVESFTIGYEKRLLVMYNRSKWIVVHGSDVYVNDT